MNLNAGTIELISIDVTDRLGGIIDLNGYAVDYRVVDSNGGDKVSWTPATAINLMRVDCLIDTTNWAKDHYELYIRPTVLSEQPILGPFDFDVV